MSGFKEYDRYDSLGLAELVKKKNYLQPSFAKRPSHGLKNLTFACNLIPGALYFVAFRFGSQTST